MSYFLPHIDQMEGYQPGKQPQSAGFTKLNTNENPYPPSPRVIEALREAANESLRLYPDPMAHAARENLAKALGVGADRVLMGCGSDDLLTMIVRAFVAPGGRVAFPYPTYTLYRTLAQLQNAVACEVDFPEDFSLPPQLADQDARAVFVANPNAPTGTMVPASSLEALAQEIDGVLVVDEAYVDFADSDCLHLVDRCPNVIVLRTLSKSYSLAGIRAGFGIAREEVIAGLAKVKDSYNVDRLSIVAAAAALEDVEYMRQNADRIRQTRAYLSEQLTGMGFFVWPSQANFVLARVPQGANAERLFQELERRRILVRYFRARRLDDCLRITIGTRDEIDKLLSQLRELLGSSAAAASRAAEK